MKTTLTLIALVLGSLSAVANEHGSADRIAALRECFHYAPIASSDLALVPEKEPIVMLERLTIMGSIARRTLATDIEERRARDAEAEFTWKKGGLLSSHEFGKFQADVGVWATLGEKIDGVFPSRGLFLKVDLLRIKW